MLTKEKLGYSCRLGEYQILVFCYLVSPIKRSCKMSLKCIIKMPYFNFGQIEVISKDFYKQKQKTDIFTIDVKKVMVSDKMPHNNGKYRRHIVGYQLDGEMVIGLSR